MNILWVDDELHILGLEELPVQASVDTAVACDVAIAKLRANSYDLLISDLILPLTLGDSRELPFAIEFRDECERRYPGVWFIRYVREQLELKLPIVVLTIVVGRDRGPIQRLLGNYIQEYISKYEIMPDDLWRRLRIIVDTSGEATSK